MQRGREKAGETAAGGNGSTAALTAVRQKGWALRRRFGQATSRPPYLFAKDLIYDDRCFETTAARQEAMYDRLVDVPYDRVQARSVVDVFERGPRRGTA